MESDCLRSDMEALRRGYSCPYGESVGEEEVRTMRLVTSLGIVALVGQPRSGGDIGELSSMSPGEVAMDGSDWLGEHL